LSRDVHASAGALRLEAADEWAKVISEREKIVGNFNEMRSPGSDSVSTRNEALILGSLIRWALASEKEQRTGRERVPDD
jgi:hypothetical protein